MIGFIPPAPPQQGGEGLKRVCQTNFVGDNVKSSSNLLVLTAFLLLCGFSASAQTPASEFKKDGLSFSYPAGWTFNDTSNADAQQMTFGRADSDAQITVFVFRALLTTPARLEEAKRVLVDKYVASTTKSFAQAGAHPESSPASTEISGIKSEGVKIRAVLDGVPGSAEIHWAVLGQRLVVLTFLGPDKARTKAMPAWDLLRTTFKIEEPQPKAQPAASPKP